MDDQDSISEMSEWESEDEPQEKRRPVFKSKTEEKEWERKERNREYRVAARREKRLRKADEKKQRKLNATLLRRMTKNPEKYTKNVSRNREREVQLERRKIWREAVAQAERLASIHDPSGKMFNVGPVVVQDDGKVISVAVLERRAKAQAEKAAKAMQDDGTSLNGEHRAKAEELLPGKVVSMPEEDTADGINPARRQLMGLLFSEPPRSSQPPQSKQLSKRQQRKLVVFEGNGPPPKPVIPEGISLPDDEENWVDLFDLSDDAIERRVAQDKKRKAAERKALRQKQKEGKAERRAARDERRRVYREKKLEWKTIKEAEVNQRKALQRVEQEEAKKIEVELNSAERRAAMEACAKLGFTLDNVEGVADIKPKALGMKGREIDFDMLEVGERPSMLKTKDGQLLKADTQKANKRSRVDLGQVVDESKVSHFTDETDGGPAGLDGDFVALDSEGVRIDPQQFGEVNYNHKLRRKLHRAIEAAQIRQELLVRKTAVEHCKQNGIEVPAELQGEYKPIKLNGRRILENGQIETEKQERVRKRLELAEYNKAAKVLRQQAKAAAVEAGLRKFAELTGQLPVVPDNTIAIGEVESPDLEDVASPSKKRRRNGDDEDARKSKKSKKSQAASTQPHNIGLVEPTKILGKPVPLSENVTGMAISYCTTPETNEISANDKTIRKERKRAKRAAAREVEGTTGDAASESLVVNVAGKSKSHKSKKSQTSTPGDEVASSLDKGTGKKSKSQSTKVVDGENKQAKDLGLGGAERWNADSLDGDAARKNKFLRLLGAGKAGAAQAAERSSKESNGLSNIKKVESDLVQQFDAGIRMKHDGQSKRKGLGA